MNIRVLNFRRYGEIKEGGPKQDSFDRKRHDQHVKRRN